MPSFFVLLVTLSVLAAGWAGLAWSADGSRFGALLLHAEPVFWLLSVVVAWRALRRRRLALSLAIASTTALGALFLRMPAFPVRDAPAPSGGAPVADAPWFATVRRCAGALAPPQGSVSVLLWTQDTSVDSATLATVALTLHPDVLVLPRLEDGAGIEAIAQTLDGEAAFFPGEDGEPGLGLVVRGQFPLCGTEDRWAEQLPSGLDARVQFVQIGESTYFPLVFFSSPVPLGGGDWDAEHLAPSRRVADLLEILGTSATMLFGDASATSTYRWMDREFTERGFAPAALPPTWPSHVFGLPFPEVQPLDRVWAGSAWHVQARRVQVPAGTHAPVYLRFDATGQTGRYQVPTNPRRPGPT